MKGKIITILLITVLAGALLSGCIGNPKSETQPTPNAAVTTTPASSGATAVQTAASSQELSGTIMLSGAFALYPMADTLGKLVDIGMISRTTMPLI
jgi:PBP1b-binding outer membrane lipoprotein LpoB